MEVKKKYNPEDDQEDVEEGTKNAVTDVDLDQEIDKQFSGGFVKKELFLEDQPPLLIVDVKKNQFDKFVLSVKGEGQPDDNAMWVGLNAPLTNKMIELFGKKPRQWIGQLVKITGKKGSWNIGNEHKEGVTLTIEKP